jgi:hypothetical protein
MLAMLVIGMTAGMYATRFSWLMTLRLLVFWFVSASFVLASWYSKDGQWIRELAAVAVILMPAYFFVRALFGNGWNAGWRRGWNPSNSSEAWERSFTIAAVIGTTTQVAWFIVLYIVLFQPELLYGSVIGTSVTNAVNALRAYEPTGWAAAGVAILALLVAAAFRFARDPFRPTPYKSMLATNRSANAAILLILPTLIIWFVVNASLFLAHYASQVVRVMYEFARDYVIRVLHLLFVLALPFALVLVGHSLARYASNGISIYLTAGARTSILNVALTGGACLTAILAYILFLTFLPLEMNWVPTIGQAAKKLRKEYTRVRGPMLTIGGTSYMVALSLLVILIPVIPLIPGALPFGPFAMACVTVAIVLVLLVWTLSRPRASPAGA